MADASVLDMGDIVVSNHSFGPSEIRQICTTISEDYSQLGILRDAVTELAQGTYVSQRCDWGSASICWANSAKPETLSCRRWNAGDF